MRLYRISRGSERNKLVSIGSMKGPKALVVADMNDETGETEYRMVLRLDSVSGPGFPTHYLEWRLDEALAVIRQMSRALIQHERRLADEREVFWSDDPHYDAGSNGFADGLGDDNLPDEPEDIPTGTVYQFRSGGWERTHNFQRSDGTRWAFFTRVRGEQLGETDTSTDADDGSSGDSGTTFA